MFIRKRCSAAETPGVTPAAASAPEAWKRYVGPLERLGVVHCGHAPWTSIEAAGALAAIVFIGRASSRGASSTAAMSAALERHHQQGIATPQSNEHEDTLEGLPLARIRSESDHTRECIYISAFKSARVASQGSVGVAARGPKSRKILAFSSGRPLFMHGSARRPCVSKRIRKVRFLSTTLLRTHHHSECRTGAGTPTATSWEDSKTLSTDAGPEGVRQ